MKPKAICQGKLMKRLVLTLLVCLLTIAAGATLVWAGGAAARGKLAPVSDYTGTGVGSYVLRMTAYPDGVYAVQLDVTARKLEAGSYHVGWIVDGVDFIYEYPVEVTAKGNLKATLPDGINSGPQQYSGSQTFKPVLAKYNSNGSPTIILEGSTVTLWWGEVIKNCFLTISWIHYYSRCLKRGALGSSFFQWAMELDWWQSPYSMAVLTRTFYICDRKRNIIWRAVTGCHNL
jgi:hypothetical protein